MIQNVQFSEMIPGQEYYGSRQQTSEYTVTLLLSEGNCVEIQSMF